MQSDFAIANETQRVQQKQPHSVKPTVTLRPNLNYNFCPEASFEAYMHILSRLPVFSLSQTHKTAGAPMRHAPCSLPWRIHLPVAVLNAATILGAVAMTVSVHAGGASFHDLTLAGTGMLQQSQDLANTPGLETLLRLCRFLQKRAE